MRINVYAPFIISALLALLAPRLAPRCRPRPAAWGLAVCALVGSATWIGSLVLLACAGLARIPAVAREGHWSVAMLSTDNPVNHAVALVGGLLLAVNCGAAALATVRQIRALRQARREARRLPGDGELAVIDDARPLAFALPGAPGRIVVSPAMLRSLDGRERQALLAHERAHLRHRHHLFHTLWQITAAADPLLRPLSRSGAYMLERWADEDAATGVRDRQVVASAVARAALASTSTGAGPVLAATGGPVPRRVRALLAPAPPRHLLAFAATVTALSVCCGSFSDAATDYRHMVVLARSFDDAPGQEPGDSGAGATPRPSEGTSRTGSPAGAADR